MFERTTDCRWRLERPEDLLCGSFERSREQRVFAKGPPQIRQIVRDVRLCDTDRWLGKDDVQDLLRVGRGQACDRGFSEMMRSYSCSISSTSAGEPGSNFAPGSRASMR